MSESPDKWGKYLCAADRKITIAAFHAHSLRAELANSLLSDDPSIAARAHFEGVLYAFVAATDQISQAIVGAEGLDFEKANLQRSLEAMFLSTLQSKLFSWRWKPIAVDLRDIRRRATHHHYRKTPLGPVVEVQPPQSAKPYSGPRSLDESAGAAVEHLGSLELLIAELRLSLA